MPSEFLSFTNLHYHFDILSFRQTTATTHHLPVTTLIFRLLTGFGNSTGRFNYISAGSSFSALHINGFHFLLFNWQLTLYFWAVYWQEASDSICIAIQRLLFNILRYVKQGYSLFHRPVFFVVTLAICVYLFLSQLTSEESKRLKIDYNTAT